MRLQGSLGHLGLADLLQTGLAGRSGGYLTLLNGPERAVLYVGETGLHLLAPDVLDPGDAVRAFVQRGVISEAAVKSARKAVRSWGVELVDRLVADGAIPQADLERLVSRVAEDTILDLLTWTTGRFVFEEGPLDPQQVGFVGRTGVDMAGVMLRAAQRMDERSGIAQSLGLHAALFVPLPAPGLEREHEEDPTPEVHGILDGHTTVDDIALVLGVGRFTVLKALHALVERGAARAANPDEMGAAAEARIDAGETRAARAILLHWTELDPSGVEPLRLLAQVALGRGDHEEELAARTALGHRLIQQGEAQEAVREFRIALEKEPNQEDLLMGWRLAAEAASDSQSYREATLRIAERALASDDAERAARLALELCANDASDLSAHFLRARAFVKLGDRKGLMSVAQGVIPLLGPRCRRRYDREIACFFRDAIAQLAPERGDLLRRFRALSEGHRVANRRVALLFALVAVAASAAVVLWPTSASTLLQQAQEAADAGDRSRALELIAELIDRFPDSQEADDAFMLQTQRLAPPRSGPRRPTTSEELRDRFAQKLAQFGPALEALPAEDALATIQDMAEFLEQPDVASLRGTLLKEHASLLPQTAQRLERTVRAQHDQLAQSRDASRRLQGDVEALRAFLAAVERARDPALAKQMTASVEMLKRISRLHKHELFSSAAGELDRTVSAFEKNLHTYDDDIRKCAETLATLDVERLYERCRDEAPKLFVAGRLEEADALYAALEAKLVSLAASEGLEPLVESVQRRHIPDFLHDRRSKIAEIFAEIEKAQALEAGGDLSAALSAYVKLVKKYWVVRFENVFTLPMRVTAVPGHATVHVAGRLVGTVPTTIRHPWGSRTEVSIQAPGYETVTYVLEAEEEHPVAELPVWLVPTRVWSRAVEAGPGADVRAATLGEDVITVDRAGNLTLYGGEDGRVRWKRLYRRLEGVRANPVMLGGTLYVAFVDGEVLFVDPKNGSRKGGLRLPRPRGDLASDGSTVALATADGHLAVLRNDTIERQVPLGIVPTAGVLAAHGAYWVGGATGTLVRVDGRTLQPRRIALPGARATVLGIAASPQGVLVNGSDGSLTHVGANGAELWSRDGLRDLVGAPAAAGDHAATADRAGGVHIFDLRNGRPRGGKQLRSAALSGLFGAGDVFVAALADGGLWIYDAARRTVRADAHLKGEDVTPPALFADGRVVLVSSEAVTLYRVPPPSR